MPKVKDMTGQRFGRLTVLYRDNNAPTGHGAFWVCQCECGNITSVRGDALRKKRTTSCGCYRNERANVTSYKRIIDLTGQRFGSLTVLHIDPDAPRGYRKQIKWICQCDCGNMISVTSYDLRSGNTKSCGCMRFLSAGARLINETLKQYNIQYDKEKTFDNLTSDYGYKLRFDFYLPDYNMCIEYDGKQHFEPIEYFGGERGFLLRTYHDRLKNEYCKQHNIDIVRIPYWKTDNEIIEIIKNIQESRNDHSICSNANTYADNSAIPLS